MLEGSFFLKIKCDYTMNFVCSIENAEILFNVHIKAKSQRVSIPIFKKIATKPLFVNFLTFLYSREY